jgi:hypothetical protein
LSEPRVLICAPATESAEAAAILDGLHTISLPNATKVLLTSGKFDAAQVAQTFNVESGYPAYPAQLETCSRWAEVDHWPDERFRDGFDLINLKRVLDKQDAVDLAVLLRDPVHLDETWPALLSELGDQSYRLFGATELGVSRSFLLNLQSQAAREIFEIACEFYLSGRSYAVSPYSMEALFEVATDALRLKDELRLAQGPESYPTFPSFA